MDTAILINCFQVPGQLQTVDVAVGVARVWRRAP
jgi:hypothetical protein